jgi:hypothetical protein
VEPKPESDEHELNELELDGIKLNGIESMESKSDGPQLKLVQ